jgi:type IV secretion system protein VirB10
MFSYRGLYLRNNLRLILRIAAFALAAIVFMAAFLYAPMASAQSANGPVQSPPAQQAPPTQQIPPAQATPPAQAAPPVQAQSPATPPANMPPAVPAQPAAAAQPPAAAQPATPGQPATPVQPATLTVPSGTKLPLVFHNALTTRNAQVGDPVYLETLFPIVLNNKILIPAGSYVQGEITSSKRPGKVKGTGEMMIRLNTLILPNGYTVSFAAVPSNAGTGGNERTDSEGKIHGDSDKGTDVGTILKGTAIGAGIGGIASRSGTGAGIGAAAGMAVSLATVLLTRGPELELPRGTTLDIVLDRTLYLDASYITFTDPGHASAIPGPPNREPTRTRSPF